MSIMAAKKKIIIKKSPKNWGSLNTLAGSSGRKQNMVKTTVVAGGEAVILFAVAHSEERKSSWKNKKGGWWPCKYSSQSEFKLGGFPFITQNEIKVTEEMRPIFVVSILRPEPARASFEASTPTAALEAMTKQVAPQSKTKYEKK
jgi:hypothetical protein